METLPNNPPEENLPESERLQKRQEISNLAKELMESRETFPFPGIDPEEYSKMKATDIEYPGFTTPTDELIKRLETDGVRIVLGDDPESGNIYVIPAQGEITQEDIFLFPRQLQISEGMDERLRKLISLNLAFFNQCKKSK